MTSRAGGKRENLAAKIFFYQLLLGAMANRFPVLSMVAEELERIFNLRLFSLILEEPATR